jgi:hypothetical protein
MMGHFWMSLYKARLKEALGPGPGVLAKKDLCFV